METQQAMCGEGVVDDDIIVVTVTSSSPITDDPVSPTSPISLLFASVSMHQAMLNAAGMLCRRPMTLELSGIYHVLAESMYDGAPLIMSSKRKSLTPTSSAKGWVYLVAI